MQEEELLITESCGNVFIDLGFDPAEAEVMKMRAEVIIRMKERLRASGWTQAEAARRLGVTQPRVSNLLKGKIEDFSLDALLKLAARAFFRASSNAQSNTSSMATSAADTADSAAIKFVNMGSP